MFCGSPKNNENIRKISMFCGRGAEGLNSEFVARMKTSFARHEFLLLFLCLCEFFPVCCCHFLVDGCCCFLVGCSFFLGWVLNADGLLFILAGLLSICCRCISILGGSFEFLEGCSLCLVLAVTS